MQTSQPSQQRTSKSDLILLLLHSRGPSGKKNEPIYGITRLMKLLFLLYEEGSFRGLFDFQAYKMGPFSSEVYPELEFLQSFPMPENPLVNTRADSKDASTFNPEELKLVDDMVIFGEEDYLVAASENNKEFSLSSIGEKVADQLWNEINPSIKEEIERIKKQYGGLTLKDLLRYIYEKYPNMTVKSEIKDQL